MKFNKIQLGFALLLLIVSALGCTNDTSTSKQPSQSEIEEAKTRRLAEIEKLKIPEEAKARMRAQVQGQPAGAGNRR
jgi:hypothetical protein